jgi:hypothetical protein
MPRVTVDGVELSYELAGDAKFYACGGEPRAAVRCTIAAEPPIEHGFTMRLVHRAPHWEVRLAECALTAEAIREEAGKRASASWLDAAARDGILAEAEARVARLGLMRRSLEANGIVVGRKGSVGRSLKKEEAVFQAASAHLIAELSFADSAAAWLERMRERALRDLEGRRAAREERRRHQEAEETAARAAALERAAVEEVLRLRREGALEGTFALSRLARIADDLAVAQGEAAEDDDDGPSGDWEKDGDFTPLS